MLINIWLRRNSPFATRSLNETQKAPKQKCGIMGWHKTR